MSQFPTGGETPAKTSGSSLCCRFFPGKADESTQRCPARQKAEAKGERGLLQTPVFVHWDPRRRTKHTQNYHPNLPPPRVQEPRRLAQRDVFLPSNLEKRGQRQLRGAERRGAAGPAPAKRLLRPTNNKCQKVIKIQNGGHSGCS